MYLYFYDKFTQDKQYEPLLTSIETRLIDLGINGRIEKLSIFKNVKQVIEDGVKKGAHTVVAVGDDKTVATVLNVLVPFKGITLGFVPVVDGSRFAHVLGIPKGAEACAVLSKRLCETVDVGKVLDQYFLGSVRISDPERVELRCDDSFTLSARTETSEIQLLNLGDVWGDSGRSCNVRDGRFELVVSPVVKGGLFKKNGGGSESVVLVKKVEAKATGEPATLAADTVLQWHTPCTVEILPQALKLIVGRNRQL